MVEVDAALPPVDGGCARRRYAPAVSTVRPPAAAASWPNTVPALTHGEMTNAGTRTP